MARYAKYLIFIFMNLNENINIEAENEEKSMGCTYKFTHISVAICPIEGIIVPFFKGGNPDEAGNYREITLINIFGKIYSQILLNRLNKWAEKEETLLDSQFGFQKGKSTVDCIFTLYSIIAKTLGMGGKLKLYCIFIDYEKAFDKIDRSFLWQKLLKEQVSGKFVNVLRSMYTVV